MKSDSVLDHITPSELLRYCQKVLEQMERAKEVVFNEFRGRAAGQEEKLQAAIGEAEALARQTRFPQLTFLDLAEEKVLDALGGFAPEHFTPGLPA